MQIDSRLKLFNVFGVVTVFPGQAIALGVGVLPSRRSIERTVTRSIDLPWLEGTHQILFGANITGGSPEIAVFQIEAQREGAPDLAGDAGIQELIREIVGQVGRALLS